MKDVPSIVIIHVKYMYPSLLCTNVPFLSINNAVPKIVASKAKIKWIKPMGLCVR